MDKIVFVTGASGYIGTQLVRRLVASNYMVIGLDMRFSNKFLAEFKGKVVINAGSILDEEYLKILFNTYAPNYIVHLAGLKNRKNEFSEFKDSINVNYMGALNLFKYALNVKSLEHIVIMGSTEEYGCVSSPYREDTQEQPNSSYGLSKLAASRLAMLFHRQFGLPVTELRPTVAYGPEQGTDMFLPAMICSLVNGQEFRMTKGEQLRDYVFVDDLIDAILLSLKAKESSGKVLNISSENPQRLCDIADMVAKYIGAENLLKIGAIPYRNTEMMFYSVDSSAAYDIIQWEPKTSIEEGIKITVDSFVDRNKG